MSKVTGKKLVSTKNLSRQEWLMYRKKGIGGSDAASIAGLNSYSSPLEVYIDKTEEEIEDSGFVSEYAEWGTEIEPVIRKKFKAKHPEWRVQQSFFMWQHPEHEFMLANVDGLIFDGVKGWGILEIKCTSEWRKDEWGEEEIIEAYLIQFQHYLAVMGVKWGVFAVLIGGHSYKEFYVERDEELIKSLIEIEKNFWENHVLAKNPPEPDGSESASEILLKLHPVSDVLEKDKVLELGKEFLKLIEELDEIKEKEKELKKRKEEINQKLQKTLGDYQVAAVEDRKVTWKPARSFNEKVLQKEKPELFKQFAVTVLDKNKFKKAYPKVYEEYMLETNKKSFSVKEDEMEYAC